MGYPIEIMDKVVIQKLFGALCFSTLGVVAPDFIVESIERMSAWLIVMFAIIVADLVASWRTHLILGTAGWTKSSALRRTLTKMAEYLFIVVAVCFIEVASGLGWNLDRWVCLVICAGEAGSVARNMLKAQGYDFDVLKLVAVLAKRFTAISKEDVNEIIKRDE